MPVRGKSCHFIHAIWKSDTPIFVINWPRQCACVPAQRANVAGLASSAVDFIYRRDRASSRFSLVSLAPQMLCILLVFTVCTVPVWLYSYTLCWNNVSTMRSWVYKIACFFLSLWNQSLLPLDTKRVYPLKQGRHRQLWSSPATAEHEFCACAEIIHSLVVAS